MEARNPDLITITEACTLLSVSRPTFNKRRDTYQFNATKGKGRRLWFSRSEILAKVISPAGVLQLVDLLITEENPIHLLKLGDNIFDLRKIRAIDPYGVISLLCAILYAASKGVVYLLINGSLIVKRLQAIGLFNEIERLHGGTVFWDKQMLQGPVPMVPETILPLTYVGYRGAERPVAAHLNRLLIQQGFSEEIGGYIAWIIGELADNAHTHGKGPCYLMAERVSWKHDYLAIAVGDVGMGIHNSLKGNPKYSALADRRAFLTAFKPGVSSWGDEHNRGRGLTDVLAIALANKSLLRVDSCGFGIGLTFPEDKPALYAMEPGANVPGTRSCLVLVDRRFKNPNQHKEEAIAVVNDALGRL